jgi:two-component system response regulator GlrR
MIGNSSAFLKVSQIIEKIARCDAPVLIEGETGTGKELAARAIHNYGTRREHPFVPINCSAIPDTPVENALFSHEGVGTLFLDEVDALSSKAQAILLRFFQDQQCFPSGKGIQRSTNVRIIAASNRNLMDLAEKGEFRLDLLFRLKIMYLTLPPLRQRHGDTSLLATHFLHECAARLGKGDKTLHPDTVSWFEKYSWPGNIRELENLIYREYMIADGETINIPPLVSANMERRRGFDRRRPSVGCLSFTEAKNHVIAKFEQHYLAEALAMAQGNVTKAASLVRKDRRAFGKLLKKHSMDKNVRFV